MMIRVIKATGAHNQRTYYLNCMHIVSIEKEDGYFTLIRTSAMDGSKEKQLLVNEDADDLANKLEAALRNLGSRPN